VDPRTPVWQRVVEAVIGCSLGVHRR
jgi:hypothetical protein